jgi:hypothetical protein
VLMRSDRLREIYASLTALHGKMRRYGVGGRRSRPVSRAGAPRLPAPPASEEPRPDR